MRYVSLASLKLLFSLAAIVASAPVHAVALACGITLYGSVTLTADVVCGPGQDGLIIGDHKVRIELNGYSIIGPYTFASPTNPAIGVRSSGFERVQIVGPGRIVGFQRPVDIDGGNSHLISGVEIVAESGLPASVRNASGSVVEMSRITAVEIASDPGFRATANRIIDNEIGADPGLPGGGIFLSGCDTADNMVASNTVDPGAPSVPVYGGRRAITVSDGAHSNQILKNKIVRGEVALSGASNNMVAGNDVSNDATVTAGVQIESSHNPVACAGWIVLPGKDNIVRGNRVRGGAFAAYLDGPPGMRLATANLVTGNTFLDQTHAGMLFGFGAADNVATGNTYINISVIVIDWGTGNLWP